MKIVQRPEKGKSNVGRLVVIAQTSIKCSKSSAGITKRTVPTADASRNFYVPVLLSKASNIDFFLNGMTQLTWLTLMWD